MKTSIFNMTFTLPPMLGMHEVEKDTIHHPSLNFTRVAFPGACC